MCSCCVCHCCVERDDQHQNMCLTLLCRQAVNVQITQHGTAYNYNLYAVQVGGETLASVRVPTGKSCHAGPALSMHIHHCYQQLKFYNPFSLPMAPEPKCPCHTTLLLSQGTMSAHAASGTRSWSRKGVEAQRL